MSKAVKAFEKPAHPTDAMEESFYQERIKVYPAAVSGTYRRIKWTILTVWLGIYYLLPFVRWDRGPGMPNQAVLADLPGRRFYFFMIEIWPQEVYYFTDGTHVPYKWRKPGMDLTSENYIDSHLPIVPMQLKRGGIRLALMLNIALDPEFERKHWLEDLVEPKTVSEEAAVVAQ